MRLRRFRRLRALSNGHFPASTLRYGKAYLADYPEDGIAWMLVGKSLVEMARYEEAEQAHSKAIEFCPPEKQHIPHAQMGHLFREAGDYEMAATWYEKAANADPNDAGYKIYLGGMRAKQGRLHEAREIHEAATKCVDGCIDEAYLNLGMVLRALGRFQEAAESLREAIRLDPEYRAAKWALRDVERCIKLDEAS